MPQTSVQEVATIRFGSGKFEVGDSIGTLVNVGAFRNGVFEETFDKISVMSDNAGEVYAGISNHKAALSCDLLEINLANLAKFQKGIATNTLTGTTPVAITDELHTLYGTTGQRLNFKNGAGTEVASIVVTEGGAARVRNTDYIIYVDTAGYTCIARTTTGAFADGDVAQVDYTYTPLASNLYKTGGNMQLTAQVVRFTNTNASGKMFYITVFKATSESGITIEFPADDADDVAATPIKMVGTCDTSRTAGDQLFEIYDEQYDGT
jgi:hypothetical protein